MVRAVQPRRRPAGGRRPRSSGGRGDLRRPKALSDLDTATGSGFDTGLIPPGATSAPIRFDNAGTYAYRCTVHPTMTGSPKVGDSDNVVNY